MGWYSDSWSLRLPVAVNNLSGSTPIDITINLAQFGDEFWDNVTDTATGYDIIAVDADGVTLLTFDLTSYNYANRAGTIEIDGYVPPSSDAFCLVWLYFKKSAPADLTSAVTIASAKTGYYEPMAPKARRLVAGPERPGSTQPAQEVHKTSSDQVFLWWDVTDLLAGRAEADEGQVIEEEVDYAQFGVEAAGSEEAGSFDETYTRFVAYDGRMWVRTLIKAGTDATNRTARLRLGTTKGQIFDCRALVKINNPVE